MLHIYDIPYINTIYIYKYIVHNHLCKDIKKSVLMERYSMFMDRKSEPCKDSIHIIEGLIL